MKIKYYVLTAITAYLVLLIATIPASLVTGLLENNQLTIKGVHGTVWQGEAYVININNSIQLQDSQWSLNAWKLLIGKVALNVNTNYQNNTIEGELGSSFLGRFFVNHLNARINANDIAQLAEIPLAQLSGLIILNIEHAHWKQGELPLASGEINWNNAAVTVAEKASLGNVNIILGESEKQLLNADIENQGGDLTISGTAELVPEADYLLKLKLSPTATASNNIKQSLGMFAKRQANGDYLITNSGSLNQIGLM